MEADNRSKEEGGLEHIDSIGKKEPPEKKRKRQRSSSREDSLEDHDYEGIQQQQLHSNTDEHSHNLAEQLIKIQEQLASVSAEFRKDVEMMKTENQLLTEKNNALTAKFDTVEAQNVELQAQNRQIQAGQKVNELAAKLASEQMAKAIEASVADKMSKAENKIAELQLALTSKVEEGNASMQKHFNKLMQENQQKFAAQQMAELDKKLEAAMTKQSNQQNQGMTELGRKLTDLENQAQQRIVELGQALTSKMEKENANLQKQFNGLILENQRKFAEQMMADWDKKLEAEMAKQSDQQGQGMADLRGKLTDLESQLKKKQQIFFNDQEAILSDIENHYKQMMEAGLENMAGQIDQKMADLQGKVATLETQAANSHKKLEAAMAKQSEQLGQGMADFRGKVATLETQTANSQKNLEVAMAKQSDQYGQGMTEMGRKLTGLESQLKENQQKLFDNQEVQKQIADKHKGMMEARLEKMTRQLDQEMADLRGNIAALESQLKECQQKCLVDQEAQISDKHKEIMEAGIEKVVRQIVQEITGLRAKIATLESQLKESQQKFFNDQEVQIADKLCKSENKITELEHALTSKVEEGNANLQKHFNGLMQENQHKFIDAKQMADWDKKWEAAMAKQSEQLGQGMVDLRGKVATLESQAANSHKKMEAAMAKQSDQQGQGMAEMGRKLTGLESQLKENLQKCFDDQELILLEVDKHKEMMEVELKKMARQLDQEMADLRGKIATLERQLAEGHKKWEEMRKAMEEELMDQSLVLEFNKSKSAALWSANRWHNNVSGRHGQENYNVQISADLLVATKTTENGVLTVRAEQPVSCEKLLASLPPAGENLVHIFYYEVLVKSLYENAIPWIRIGWVADGFPLNSPEFWVGEYPGSYAVDSTGKLCQSEQKLEGYGDKFLGDDLAGSGVVLTQNGKLKMFFTLNGQLNGKPIPLDTHDLLLLYPAVSITRKDVSLEANFGADPAEKPFLFDIKEAYEAGLFD